MNCRSRRGGGKEEKGGAAGVEPSRAGIAARKCCGHREETESVVHSGGRGEEIEGAESRYVIMEGKQIASSRNASYGSFEKGH